MPQPIKVKRHTHASEGSRLLLAYAYAQAAVLPLCGNAVLRDNVLLET